jgi:hypothetical protein
MLDFGASFVLLLLPDSGKGFTVSRFEMMQPTAVSLK